MRVEFLDSEVQQFVFSSRLVHCDYQHKWYIKKINIHVHVHKMTKTLEGLRHRVRKGTSTTEVISSFNSY